MLFIEYPKCTTCIKAKKYLDAKKAKYEDRHIKDNNPTKEELTKWIKKYNIEIKKLFNTSGMKYRELGLKEKLPNMTDEEKINLLATDGMLVKRPLLITDNNIVIGFKEKEYENILK